MTSSVQIENVVPLSQTQDIRNVFAISYEGPHLRPVLLFLTPKEIVVFDEGMVVFYILEALIALVEVLAKKTLEEVVLFYLFEATLALKAKSNRGNHHLHLADEIHSVLVVLQQESEIQYEFHIVILVQENHGL